jgi:hypothetical protein
MKYIKKYKVFESITEKDMDDVAEDIREILLPLKHDRVNFKVEPHFITNPNLQHFIEVDIKGENIKNYIDELRQLVSTLDDKGWSIINDRGETYSWCKDKISKENIETLGLIFYFDDIDSMTTELENKDCDIINFRFYEK